MPSALVVLVALMLCNYALSLPREDRVKADSRNTSEKPEIFAKFIKPKLVYRRYVLAMLNHMRERSHLLENAMDEIKIKLESLYRKMCKNKKNKQKSH